MSRSRRYLFKWIISFARQHSIKIKKLTVKKYVEDHIDSFQVNFPSLYHLKPSEKLWSFIFFRWSKGEHWPKMGKPYMNFHAWNDTSVFLWVLLNFFKYNFFATPLSNCFPASKTGSCWVGTVSKNLNPLETFSCLVRIAEGIV